MERQIIRVLLVDDEPLIQEDLQARLRQYPYVQVAGTASSYQEAMALLERAPIDLVFTDIQMANGTGFELSRAIQRRWPKLLVVFLTGHSGFALEGYEYQPLDFLVKPVCQQRLERVIERARQRLQAAPTPEVSIALNTETGMRFFRPSELSYVEKTGRRVRILCRDGREFWAAIPLREAAGLLADHGFYRCHQSYVVSLDEVAGIQKEPFGRSYCITLRSSKAEIPMSRGNYHELLELLDGRQSRRE